MLLQDQESGSLVKVLDVEKLIDPSEAEIPARLQSGQEEQDPTAFAKTQLVFPSGETLPQCWLDADYRLHDAPKP